MGFYTNNDSVHLNYELDAFRTLFPNHNSIIKDLNRLAMIMPVSSKGGKYGLRTLTNL